jgi:hypothetical protein
MTGGAARSRSSEAAPETISSQSARLWIGRRHATQGSKPRLAKPRLVTPGLKPRLAETLDRSATHTLAPRLGQARPWLKFVRRHGVLQFISLYNQRKNDTAEELQWGDEIEYQLVAFDDESRTVRISLR